MLLDAGRTIEASQRRLQINDAGVPDHQVEQVGVITAILTGERESGIQLLEAIHAFQIIYTSTGGEIHVCERIFKAV